MIKNLRKNILLLAMAALSSALVNAQSWDTIPTPVSTNLILQDIVFPAGQSSVGYTGGTNVTYNGKGKILKTTDGGDTWVVQWESDVIGTGVTSLHFFDTMNGFAGTMSGDIMKTTDGGSTWISSDIDPLVDQGELSDLDFYDEDNGALVSQWNGIYFTNDGGETWTVASTNYLGAIDLYFATSTVVFAVGYDQNIYKSEDGGETWTFSFQGPDGQVNQYINLGVYFLDENNGIVTSEDGAYFTTNDGGASWSEETIPNQSGLMRSAYMFNVNDIYICATPGEVFNTADGGIAWESEYFNINPAFYKITFTSDGTGFVCGSASNGGTILKMDPTGVGVNELELVELELYPNPSSDLINIQFSLNNSTAINANILDSNGKIVMSETIQARSGENRNQFNVSQLSKGSYILSLASENSVIQSRRFQIID